MTALLQFGHHVVPAPARPGDVADIDVAQALGAGGTVKEGRIEIQGDKRDEVALILTEAGFRPVFAGG